MCPISLTSGASEKESFQRHTLVDVDKILIMDRNGKSEKDFYLEMLAIHGCCIRQVVFGGVQMLAPPMNIPFCHLFHTNTEPVVLIRRQEQRWRRIEYVRQRVSRAQKTEIVFPNLHGGSSGPPASVSNRKNSTMSRPNNWTD